MGEKISRSITRFTISYKNEPVEITTGDYIKFDLVFRDGTKKDMTFEINTEMDVQWFFYPHEVTEQADAIGSLIVKQMMS
jgi:hypothetical protein